jgi:hypothetical protein
MSGLPAFVQANKKALGVAGAVLVGGLALVQARKGDAPDTNNAAGAYAAGGYSTGGGPVYSSPGGYAPTYDSTGADIAAALAPVQAHLQQLAEQQAAKGGAVPVSTNTDWIGAATEGWVGRGGNAVDIQAALGQYLAGRPVNQAQTAGINWAIKNYGASPGGTSGVSKVVPVKKK